MFLVQHNGRCVELEMAQFAVMTSRTVLKNEKWRPFLNRHKDGGDDRCSQVVSGKVIGTPYISTCYGRSKNVA